MNEEMKNALVELASYVMKFRLSLLVSTNQISDKSKEVIINGFNAENIEETIKQINNN